MRYREFGRLGIEVSALGFGCMRLPVLDPEDRSKIDEALATKMVRHAIDSGVNYLDTAYMYHGQQSERFVGRVLQDGYREKVYLATKLPMGAVKEEADFDRFLNEQLSRLQTDHIDFYLLHGLNKDRWETAKRCRLFQKLEEAREDGRIRYVGFSFHDDLPTFRMIVDGYEGWDFCQVQYNYINTDSQAGMEGVQYAAAKGLGVIVMEPLLGGKLVNVPAQVEKVLDPSRKPIEWAFDFVWSQPEVSLVLSGMSTMEQVEENLVLADRAVVGTLQPQDFEMLKEAKRVFETMAYVPCTKCGYCMPCPFGLEIPKIFETYNTTAVKQKDTVKEQYQELAVKADACQKCRRCEKECPQEIKISEVMEEVNQVFA